MSTATTTRKLRSSNVKVDATRKEVEEEDPNYASDGDYTSEKEVFVQKSEQSEDTFGSTFIDSDIDETSDDKVDDRDVEKQESSDEFFLAPPPPSLHKYLDAYKVTKPEVDNTEISEQKIDEIKEDANEEDDGEDLEFSKGLVKDEDEKEKSEDEDEDEDINFEFPEIIDTKEKKTPKDNDFAYDSKSDNSDETFMQDFLDEVDSKLAAEPKKGKTVVNNTASSSSSTKKPHPQAKKSEATTEKTKVAKVTKSEVVPTPPKKPTKYDVFKEMCGVVGKHQAFIDMFEKLKTHEITIEYSSIINEVASDLKMVDVVPHTIKYGGNKHSVVLGEKGRFMVVDSGSVYDRDNKEHITEEDTIIRCDGKVFYCTDDATVTTFVSSSDETDEFIIKHYNLLIERRVDLYNNTIGVNKDSEE